MGRKYGGSTPFLGRGARSPSNTNSPGPRTTSTPSGILIRADIWPQQIWAENRGLCPFGGRGAGPPSNTMCPAPRPTCTPSFILIRPTVCHNTPTSQTGQDRTGRTDRQTDRQDNSPIAQGKPFYKRSPKNYSYCTRNSEKTKS